MSPERRSSIEARVPASTANLGAGFDCFGLALDLYLSVRASVLPSDTPAKSRVRSRGARGSLLLTRDPEQNLILRAMHHAAARENFVLPPVSLAVHNEVPVASGLGSSAAAIVAGIALAFGIAGRALNEDSALRYASEIEGHADNVGAALTGGLVVTSVRPDGSVIVVRKKWPLEIRVVAVSPDLELNTTGSRAVLPQTVRREDAIHNLQRSALFIAALEERRYDLLWDAMQDRLHQHCRQHLIPGLAGILSQPRSPGLLGIALSGAGPSVVALATEHFDEIGKSIAAHFENAGLGATIRCLSVPDHGSTTTANSRGK
ncbi:MAG: homoserine kinase [Candidatus Acidiferrales bacterium]|jgi:homoserine kinase